MDKRTLGRYKPNKRELVLIDKAIDRLYDRLANVPEVSGKVSKSGDDFPYIEEHITVKMEEPKAATEIKKQIGKKEFRRTEILNEMSEVEKFIEQLPEGEDKRIFELTYLEGMKQQKVADEVGLERSSISKRISKYL